MSYDQKCYDLAEAFLQDEPTVNTDVSRHVLAQAIQETIEAELRSLLSLKDKVPALDGARP